MAELSMEQLIHTLGNLGAMGALAAVLLFLYREALQAFREEMREERNLARQTWREHLSLQMQNHSILVNELHEQTKQLAEIRVELSKSRQP